jgi:hypothetical protein
MYAKGFDVLGFFFTLMDPFLGALFSKDVLMSSTLLCP